MVSEALSAGRLQKILADHGFWFRKRWGQNFLVDENIVRKITAAAEITPGDVVVEIGAGAGTLTRALAAKAELVIALEIDQRLLPVLAETLGGFSNVEVVWESALDVDFDRLVAGAAAARNGGLPLQTYKVVANIPYSITTPLLLHLLRGGFRFDFLLLMLQQEVARRLAAGPGCKDYGALSIVAQYYTVPKILFRVPKTVFYPRPEVDSAVVRLQRRANPAVRVFDEEIFFRLVRGAFSPRRKTIVNALAHSRACPGFSRESWQEVLRAAGVDPARRGESLSLEEFAALAAQVGKK
ncbi:MAG: 16S rRNA (adenine(1518)-N(6)/adenine(1519)-N(6))-dimethyltransferase RsmA [Desulfotomaculales bacterium]